ncbi:hypothetical protein ACHAXA_006635 [Cyclostephanos tholiformis]|uniref:HECT-type E3 ubiquitin transferase n=1 Tax=Cyclostephanos tholiformis TaxID=382380 RepID=A0ABD3R765_9STRA
MFSRLGSLARRRNSRRTSTDDSTASSVGAAERRVSEIFRITIPNNINPGEEFQVDAGGRRVRVRCPPNTRPGEQMQITVPVERINEEGNSEHPSPPPDSSPHPPRSRNAPGVGQSTRSDKEEEDAGESQGDEGDASHLNLPPIPDQQEAAKTVSFQVIVPPNVNPGHPFALLAMGARVLVTCPIGAMPGMKIQFDLPVGLLKKPDGPKSKLAEIKLSYDKDGWTRTIRMDMKFQWTRLNETSNIDEINRFDPDRSAYVLKLDYLDNDNKLRRGRCSLVTAERGVVDSKIKSLTGSDLVSYSDIVNAQMKSYEDKIQWFHETCTKLSEDWGKTANLCTKIPVRREFLLRDSIAKVMSLTRGHLRTVWRIEYIGEDGIDAGGLAREWFDLVTKEVFDPAIGLWKTSESNQMCLEINPASEINCPEHLIYFRFLGRVMGKAIFDRQLINGHMVKHLYKHILGWPVMFNDLKDIDEEYYNSLKLLHRMGADVEYASIDFTQTEEILGEKKQIELISDGANVSVTRENLPEYIEACLKYRLLGRYEAQLNELLLGFYDVIPEPLLTIFDFQELELLMCGLPEINMDDWIKNTDYSSSVSMFGPRHEVCQWFWEVVSKYDQEMKARLLQFVTGTSGVPAGGFSSLQGMNVPGRGTLRKFTIYGIPLAMSNYPRSQ